MKKQYVLFNVSVGLKNRTYIIVAGSSLDLLNIIINILNGDDSINDNCSADCLKYNEFYEHKNSGEEFTVVNILNTAKGKEKYCGLVSKIINKANGSSVLSNMSFDAYIDNLINESISYIHNSMFQ